MSLSDRLFESRIGPWFAALLGLLWLIVLLLLFLHLVRRRTGWYRSHPFKNPSSRIFLWITDGFLFILVCGFAAIVVWLFSPIVLSWILRIGILSGAFAVICVIILLREGLAQRVTGGRKQKSKSSFE